MDSNTLNSNAHQKLATVNPSTKKSQSMTRKALMTKRNRPKVRKVTGMVTMISAGLKKVFKSANTKATQMVVCQSAMEMPLRK